MRLAWISRVALPTLVGAGSLALALEASPVYEADVNISFSADGGTPFENGRYEDSIKLVAVGVQERLNDSADSLRTTDPFESLFGMGMRAGFSVRAPNYGGQWVNSYRSVLIVRGVGTSPAQVQQEVRNGIANVRAELLSIQDELNVSPDQRIAVIFDPAATYPRQVSPGLNQRLLGACVTGGSVLAFVLCVRRIFKTSFREARK